MPSLDMGKKNIVTAIKSSPARHANSNKSFAVLTLTAIYTVFHKTCDHVFDDKSGMPAYSEHICQ